MNRVIKFRAWDKEDKRMITHNQEFIPLMVTNWGVMKLSPHHEENLWFLIAYGRFELMQYTGLKDKNSKEIYEGDILKYQHSENSKEYVGEIFYKTESASFWIKTGSDSGFALLGQQQIMEVIGNIYENESPTVVNKNK